MGRATLLKTEEEAWESKTMLRRLIGRLKGAPVDRKALLGTFCVLIGLSIFREWDIWTTGFLATDEMEYSKLAISHSVYPGRFVFSEINNVMFRLFGVNGVDKFAIFLPAYGLLWSGLTVLLFYAIMKKLGFNARTVALSLFSALFILVYVLLAISFLTEPVGLLFAMLGIYMLLRFAKGKSELGVGQMLISALGSSVGFTLAAGVREPYGAYLVGGTLAFVVAARDWKPKFRGGSKTRWLLVGLAVLLFVGPPLLYLSSSGHAASVVLGSLSKSFKQLGSDPGSIISTTLETFVLSMLLGYGPILAVVTLVGLAIVTIGAIRLRDSSRLVIILLSLTAFCSTLVAGFTFSSVPNFVSFGNFSTILRLAHTSLPAYFLVGPFAQALIVRKKKLLYGYVTLLVIFVLVATPTLELYAASNVTLNPSTPTFTGGNPFSLSYRSPGVQVRDYIQDNPGGGPFIVVGSPLSKTPGGDTLLATTTYGYVNNTSFLTYRWTTFYLYVGTESVNATVSRYPYLAQFIYPRSQEGSSQYPYKVGSDQVVLSGLAFELIRIELQWTPSVV